MLPILRAQQSQPVSQSAKLPYASPLPPVSYKTAETTDELEQSYRLLHDNYVEQGYMFPHPSGLRVTIFNALPTTRTFIAVNAGRVVSCLTLVPDSPLGLPMDDIYREELDGLRRSGRRMAEVSGLATDRSVCEAGCTILLNLVKCLYAQALASGLDDICIAVNPSHKRFYETGLGFRVLGDLKTYSSVNYAPAYALRLEVRAFASNARAANSRLYRSLSRDLEEFSKVVRLENDPTMSETMLNHFFCRRTDIFARANHEVVDFVRRQYPCYNFAKFIGRPK
jgi:hypothetical protein